jgi:hypothetical protein
MEMSINNGIIGGNKQQPVDNNNKKVHPGEQQLVFNKEMYQPKDRLKIDIELIKMLMVNMS